MTPVLEAPTNVDANSDAAIALTTSGDSALVSYSGPSGTLADVTDTTPPDHISVYVVRPDDNLATIAKMFNVSVNTIIWANNLKSATDIYTGETLVILPISGVKRVIAAGDTLPSIAKKYNADANEIAQFNGLDPHAALAVGSTLIIPGGEGTTKVTAPKKKIAKNARSGAEPYLGGGGPPLPGYYQNPVPGAPLTQGLHGHNGVDFGAKRGMAIHAAAAGTVIISRNNGGWNGGYGNYVVLSHNNGTQTLYAHMSNDVVSVGQSVGAGQVLGYVGSTGESTGAHLHFEVRGAANPFAR